ncbi:MAG: protein-methionine-sulfoxide reductase catalytic subunit MsrP [Acidobacteria bacterium]|nr:protein-methionine-sulfoxide reductase catalytic subunit MsrP [Acidobacteriota bacterium]
MLIRKPTDIPFSEVTPQSLYLRRREFFQAAASGALAAATVLAPRGAGAQTGPKLPNVRKTPYGQGERLNSYADVTGYNNFYEFGTGKEDPAANAKDFTGRPWTIKVDGRVKNAGDHDIDSFIKPYALEERIYRLRCVEGWSMVIPWVGIPLADVINRLEPEPGARFVEFTTLNDARRMPGLNVPVLRWPYVEGLRMDEAMNPLSILAVGVYGEALPGQNGAPIRLVVPWKYGFKSTKSIVRIRFTDSEPRNSWQVSAPREYGFYANVNPEVDHPRWSQATERRLGEFRRRPTEMFNGYGDQVARMYAGMDLRKNF